MKSIDKLNIHLYADGADKNGILSLYEKPHIKGLTTNPTLMNKSGIKDYEAFAREILETVTDKPLSLEVFTDDLVDMKRQALKISSWGSNVYVKIPITNSNGASCISLIKELADSGVKLNVTALMTLHQVSQVSGALNSAVPIVVSVFAGRIADTGTDPMPIMKAAKEILLDQPNAKLLWASVREVLNIIQAEESGCDIVTVPHDILEKAAKMYGMDLATLSLETVQMFAQDAARAGYTL
jgi:transaldolase